MVPLISKRYEEVSNYVDRLLDIELAIKKRARSRKNQNKYSGKGAAGLQDITLSPIDCLWEGKKRETVLLALSLPLFDALKKDDIFKLFCKDYSIEEIALHMKDKLSITDQELDALKALHNEKDYLPEIQAKVWLAAFVSIGLFFLKSVPKEFVEFIHLSYTNYIIIMSFCFFIVLLMLLFFLIFQWKTISAAKKRYKLIKTLFSYFVFWSEKDECSKSHNTIIKSPNQTNSADS